MSLHHSDFYRTETPCSACNGTGLSPDIEISHYIGSFQTERFQWRRLPRTKYGKWSETFDSETEALAAARKAIREAS